LFFHPSNKNKRIIKVFKENRKFVQDEKLLAFFYRVEQQRAIISHHYNIKVEIYLCPVAISTQVMNLLKKLGTGNVINEQKKISFLDKKDLRYEEKGKSNNKVLSKKNPGSCLNF
jgi:hypothetical protein